MNILGLLGCGGNNIMLQAFGAMMQVRQIISEIYHEASADEKAVIKESIEKMRLIG